MFSPIKNFITYIQKNASGNSIFGGNSSTDELAKMETENLKTEGANTMEPKTENQDEKEEVSKKDKMETDKEDEKEIFEEQEKETSMEDVKDVKNISKEDKKETSKEDKEEILKEDKKETVKEDKKEISKEDKKVISKEDKKVVSKEDKKVIYKDDKKETSKEIKKETSQEEKKETSQEDKKEASKEDKKQTSKEDTNQTSKEDKMEASKEDKKVTSKEDNKETLKEVKKETSKEDKTETSKQNKKEISKEDKIKTSKVDQKQTSEIDKQGSSQEDNKLTSTEEEANKTSAKDKNENLEKKENEQNNKHAEDTKTKTITTTSTISAENSRDFEEDEVEDEDDIEAQIDTSIMLKKPVKVAATNGTEIVEVKRRNSNSGTSIVISHDYNRNMALTPIDDELQDFRHDPTAVLGTSTSTTSSNQHLDEFCSVGSAEEAKERDDTMAEDFPTEEEEDEDEDNKGKRKRKRGEDDNETETEVDEKFVDDEDEEDQFLDLENYHANDDVIVLSDIDLNTSTASLDTVNTADDPLAIACEEEEAFAADKKAALEELNLLNTSQTSQDEDTTTTIDDDLQWLKTDLEDPQPSCSNSKALAIKDNAAAATTTPEKEERNGEGSDSGLGSETSALHTTTTSITDTSQLNTTATATPMHTPTQLKLKDDEEMVVVSNLLQITSKSPTKDPLKPFRSNLKRRLEVDDDVVDGLGNLTSSSSASSSNLSDHSTLNGSLQKKPKRSINFDTVQVYYFPRQQGFSCVPSAGGCTLGMGARHVGFKTLTLAEHAAELRRAHRMQLQEINPRGSSSDDSEESEEDYLSEGSGSDLDGESNGFLQPVSPKQRRALLKAAGIRKIDPSEKADCRNIRNSREVCGCTCRDFCDPETCACSQSGIKCQVDRDMFPCGCSRDACGNTIGRVEFNPARVRTHFIHTLMRLEMENRQQQNPYSSAVASPSNPLQPTNPTPASYYQSHLQPQSNYSSGYASPAYNTVSDLHQQTAASSYYNPQTPSIANSLYGQQPASSLEMTHNSSATTVSSQYAIDSLDSSLFGGSTTAQPSYGELMPVASYHYANAQSQGAPYNSYHNTTIYHNATTTTLNTPPNTYSSCAVPSIPPYGTATTTEATGVYHSVNSLTNLETTTAPSCNVNNTSSLETEVSSSFISLSTPMASSSRLSQINDLLQHNRNTTTALVAVTQALGGAVLSSSSSSLATTAVSSCNGGNYNVTSSSINTPPIEDAHKSCMAYEELAPPLNPAPIVGVVENINKGPDKLAQLPPLPPLTAAPRSAIMATTSETLPQTSLCKTTDKEETVTAATNEPTTIEVAAGN